MTKENITNASSEKVWQSAAGADAEQDLGIMSLEECGYYESL